MRSHRFCVLISPYPAFQPLRIHNLLYIQHLLSGTVFIQVNISQIAAFCKGSIRNLRQSRTIHINICQTGILKAFFIQLLQCRWKIYIRCPYHRSKCRRTNFFYSFRDDQILSRSCINESSFSNVFQTFRQIQIISAIAPECIITNSF